MSANEKLSRLLRSVSNLPARKSSYPYWHLATTLLAFWVYLVFGASSCVAQAVNTGTLRLPLSESELMAQAR
jgi:hypothetical protein